MAGLDLDSGMSDLESITEPLLQLPDQVLSVCGDKVFLDHYVTAQRQLL